MIKVFLVLFIIGACANDTEAIDNKTEVAKDNQTIVKLEPVESQKRWYLGQWWDLNSRPLPQWYDSAKFGIIVHWGVYSVPGVIVHVGSASPSHPGGTEWFNIGNSSNSKIDYLKHRYPKRFGYQNFAESFKCSLFSPDEWADLFVKSGAKYVVVTSNHHDAYALFPTKVMYGWNSVDIGPRLDLVGALATAVKNKSLDFGVYYSLEQNEDPLLMSEPEEASDANIRTYTENVIWPEIKQLVNDYKPSIIWADGSFSHSTGFFDSANILAWLFNESPVKDRVVVNDRWGSDTFCRYGSFLTCQDRYLPDSLQSRKWEGVFSLDKKSWGHRHNCFIWEMETTGTLLKKLIQAVSLGGNFMLNVAPTSDGLIPLIYQERLLSLGEWLQINGEAIYGTSPWYFQRDSDNTWYTCKKTEYNAAKPTAPPKDENVVTAIYAIIMNWPEDDTVKLHHINKELLKRYPKVEMLGEKNKLNVSFLGDFLIIELPQFNTVKSKYAWTLKFSNG